jgi:hypothetical protein
LAGIFGSGQLEIGIGFDSGLIGFRLDSGLNLASRSSVEARDDRSTLEQILGLVIRQFQFLIGFDSG